MGTRVSDMNCAASADQPSSTLRTKQHYRARSHPTSSLDQSNAYSIAHTNITGSKRKNPPSVSLRASLGLASRSSSRPSSPSEQPAVGSVSVASPPQIEGQTNPSIERDQLVSGQYLIHTEGKRAGVFIHPLAFNGHIAQITSLDDIVVYTPPSNIDAHLSRSRSVPPNLFAVNPPAPLFECFLRDPRYTDLAARIAMRVKPNTTAAAAALSARGECDIKQPKREEGCTEGSVTIKPFYFPKKTAAAPPSSIRQHAFVKKAFSSADGLSVDRFHDITTKVCGLSAYLNGCLFKRIDTEGSGRVTLDAFTDFWANHIQNSDLAARVFHVLKPHNADREYLVRADFEPLIFETVHRHPGLTFLNSTEFQCRYVETVIARIFYKVNRARNDKMTLRELQRSKFVEVLMRLDVEDDINKLQDYFSYEHFYVIYVKFWQLDSDHDFLISSQDLAKYDNFAIAPRMVDRIMSGSPWKLTSGQADRMGYKDFVSFLLSEVDKTSSTAIEYWFRLVDTDGDGVISLFEMEPFFNQQRDRIMARQKIAAADAPSLVDVLCQLNDMIKPAKEGQFTLRDIKRSKQATAFFDTLFNVNKYVAADHKDPYVVHRVRMTPHFSDWDRYAHTEYQRLATEVQNGTIGHASSQQPGASRMESEGDIDEDTEIGDDYAPELSVIDEEDQDPVEDEEEDGAAGIHDRYLSIQREMEKVRSRDGNWTGFEAGEGTASWRSVRRRQGEAPSSDSAASSSSSSVGSTEGSEGANGSAWQSDDGPEDTTMTAAAPSSPPAEQDSHPASSTVSWSAASEASQSEGSQPEPMDQSESSEPQPEVSPASSLANRFSFFGLRVSQSSDGATSPRANGEQASSSSSSSSSASSAQADQQSSDRSRGSRLGIFSHATERLRHAVGLHVRFADEVEASKADKARANGRKQHPTASKEPSRATDVIRELSNEGMGLEKGRKTDKKATGLRYPWADRIGARFKGSDSTRGAKGKLAGGSEHSAERRDDVM